MTPSLKTARRAILPAAALGLIVFAASVATRPEDGGAAAQPAAPPASPGADQGSVVAALGLVEPSSEVISIASELSGVVRTVIVKPGQEVRKGDPLFRLDSRALDAQVAAAQARLRVAEIEARDAQSRAGLFANVSDPRAVSSDERDRAKFAKERADANVALLRAELNELETDRARLTVRAPLSGEVLRVNIRPGEYAAAGPASEPLIALGDVTPLHVRVQIDEEDAARVAVGASAEGALRGDGQRRVALTFVRFEPQATPKQNLTGGAERVDTRVVEAIYAFDRDALPAFVGQQMDVFVDAKPIAAAGAPQKLGAR